MKEIRALRPDAEGRALERMVRAISERVFRKLMGERSDTFRGTVKSITGNMAEVYLNGTSGTTPTVACRIPSNLSSVVAVNSSVDVRRLNGQEWKIESLY